MPFGKLIELWIKVYEKDSKNGTKLLKKASGIFMDFPMNKKPKIKVSK